MKHLFTLAIFIFLVYMSVDVKAQGTADKLKFEKAEQRYLDNDYDGTITLLEELEQKGLKNPKVMHLKIMAQKHLVAGIRYEQIKGGFTTIDILRKDCDYYLRNYDIEGLEDKYKEVYAVANQIQSYPNTPQEWDMAIKDSFDEKKSHKEKVIQDFCNNTIRIEKGLLIRGARVYRKERLKTFTDAELIEAFKDRESRGYPMRIIEFDYDFDVTAKIQPVDEIVQAVLNESDYKSLNAGNGSFTDSYTFTYASAQMFINALNEKTGKKYRLIKEAELEYIQMGTNKFVEEISEKKIIGGNKRKGYEYEYKRYYVYPHQTMELNTDFKDYKESMKKNKFIFWNGSLVECAIGEEGYRTFSGKASSIPDKNFASVRYSNFPPKDIGDMSSAYTNSEIREGMILVLEE